MIMRFLGIPWGEVGMDFERNNKVIFEGDEKKWS
jgi:hypothetical protein